MLNLIKKQKVKMKIVSFLIAFFYYLLFLLNITLTKHGKLLLNYIT